MEEMDLPEIEVGNCADTSASTHNLLQRDEKRIQHAQKETEFLRLRRSRLGQDDFKSLKV